MGVNDSDTSQYAYSVAKPTAPDISNVPCVMAVWLSSPKGGGSDLARPARAVANGSPQGWLNLILSVFDTSFPLPNSTHLNPTLLVPHTSIPTRVLHTVHSFCSSVLIRHFPTWHPTEPADLLGPKASLQMFNLGSNPTPNTKIPPCPEVRLPMSSSPPTRPFNSSSKLYRRSSSKPKLKSRPSTMS